MAYSFYHRKTFLVFRLIEDIIYSVSRCATWALQIQTAFDEHDHVIRYFKMPSSANVLHMSMLIDLMGVCVFVSRLDLSVFFSGLNINWSPQRCGHSTGSSNWLQWAVYGLWKACWDAAWHVWLEWNWCTSARQVLCRRLFKTELWSVMWRSGLHQSSHQIIVCWIGYNQTIYKGCLARYTNDSSL